MLNSATVKGETLVLLFSLGYSVLLHIGAFCLTVSVALITGLITGQYGKTLFSNIVLISSGRGVWHRIAPAVMSVQPFAEPGRFNWALNCVSVGKLFVEAVGTMNARDSSKPVF